MMVVPGPDEISDDKWAHLADCICEAYKQCDRRAPLALLLQDECTPDIVDTISAKLDVGHDSDRKVLFMLANKT